MDRMNTHGGETPQLSEKIKPSFILAPNEGQGRSPYRAPALSSLMLRRTRGGALTVAWALLTAVLETIQPRWIVHVRQHVRQTALQLLQRLHQQSIVSACIRCSGMRASIEILADTAGQAGEA